MLDTHFGARGEIDVLNGTGHRALRSRLGMVLVSATLVLGAGGLAPIHASAATTTRALTFISKTFTVKDYQGSILMSRGVSGSSVQLLQVARNSVFSGSIH